MVRSTALLLLAVSAFAGEAWCVLEREKVFLRWHRAGSLGCWVGGSCRLR